MKENSKVADTNVGNIKEDIKILENWLKELNELFKNTHINNTKERKALEHILSDYKRALKENELLRKDIEGWKKYCEEIEEEQTEMSNKNCELEFEIEKLQKENEELKEIDEKKSFERKVEEDR